MNRKISMCSVCGCECDNCYEDNIHLHKEIESLKQALKVRDERICNLDSQILNHANEYPQGEMQALRDNLLQWQNKYERLLENHRKLQKVNQGLEDKLLKVADRFSSEKIGLNQIISDLSEKLANTEKTVDDFKKQCENYRKDYDLMVHHSSSIVNIDSFPNDFQNRLQEHLKQQEEDIKNQNIENNEPVRVPILTFPPTAIMYSLNDNHKKYNKDDNVNKPSYLSLPIKNRFKQQNGTSTHSNGQSDTMII